MARAPGNPALFPTKGAGVTIHVVNNGWHAGLILHLEDLRAAAFRAQDSQPADAVVLLDLARIMGQGEWVEIGWGDEAFYRADVAGLLDLPIWTGVKALFGSSPTLMQVFPGSGDPAAVFFNSDVMALTLSEAGFDAMALALAAAFERAPGGWPVDIGPGLYGSARFFAARGRYSALMTCNNWVSAMLRRAGVPSSAVFSTFSYGLAAELRLRSVAN
ncbi:MAG: DUF2459 domain-containing protein [Pseudomonadota bacterium]